MTLDGAQVPPRQLLRGGEQVVLQAELENEVTSAPEDIALDIVHEDLGFDEPWLVVDVRVKPGAGKNLPTSCAQFCEPARPTTYLIGVEDHRRWEIMLLPGEDPKAMEADEQVWRLLSRWITPEEGTLWRQASYRFHALVAERWRVGRVFGDSRHLTSCECWGPNPTCYAAGEHIAVNFARACEEVVSEDKESLRLLDGLTVQRVIWSPTPFGEVYGETQD